MVKPGLLFCVPRLKVLAVNYPDGEQRKRVEKLRLALLKEKEWSDTEYADILSKVPPPHDDCAVFPQQALPAHVHQYYVCSQGRGATRAAHNTPGGTSPWGDPKSL